ncbi:MAG: type I restriction-modification system subunit M, partial [Victivallales bacterium]|nr:type I restriction-modification system subunit M [Victivallales bacterium]
MNKQQLAAKIWESANRMRSKIEANEYKDYILGFIFYKFLSDKEVKYLLEENDWTPAELPQLSEEDGETVQNCQHDIGYFIGYENLFSTWIAQGGDFKADQVTSALHAFSRLINSSHRKVFDGVFTTLETGLSKLGESSGARTKAIRDLIYLIKDIPMDGRQDYDVLGFIYEYLISNFAANAGKKAGEFYTPHEVSLLMSEIVAWHLHDRTDIQIYDPTSGSGSLLINIGQCVAQHTGNGERIKYYAQELKENTYNLTRMNLVMRGISPYNIVTRNGDTLEDDWPYFDENDPAGTYEPLYVDAVVSNPPYSQAWNPADKEADPRYARFGLAPRGKADYAFLLHDLYHLKPDGIMTIVLPHGVLFRGGEEGEIRKNLVEQNHIDAIIGLPANIFFGTGIPTIIMVLRQRRPNTDILIVDASKGFAKAGKNNILRASDIRRIVVAVENRSTIQKFSRKVERDEVRANGYNLNIPRYVDSSEEPEHWDIYASMFGGIPASELKALSDYWKAFPGLQPALFQPKNVEYFQPVAGNLPDAVNSH